MADLQALKLAADNSHSAFEALCLGHGYADKWEALRAMDQPDSCPALPALQASWDSHVAATHAFYLARDGAKGFLG
jgi:hypothetical protein